MTFCLRSQLANERRALRAHVAASKARAEACEVRARCAVLRADPITARRPLRDTLPQAMWADLRDLHAQVTHGLRAALTLADSMRAKAREQRLKLRSVQDALSEAADDADSQAARSELTQLEYERHATVGTLRGATNAIGERQQMLQAITDRMKKLKESCGPVLTTYATRTHRLELLDEEYEMRTLVKRAEEATLAEYARVAQAAQVGADEE